MKKKSFANRFGLIALLSVSLFASTAFAGNTPAPTQVVVTNTPAQPVPMVGLTKDSDAPARKPFQTAGISVPAPNGQVTFQNIVSVPANQRLVIEQVSGSCSNVGWVYLDAFVQSPGEVGLASLPKSFYSNGGDLMPVRLYVNPGETLRIAIDNSTGNPGYCYLAIAGYFVNLP